MYILKSSVIWKASSEKYGWDYLDFQHLEIFDMTEIKRMPTMFLALKHPTNMHMKFLSIPEVAAEKDMISFQIEGSHLHIATE